MSDGWTIVADDMVSRESPPRILKDIQEITIKLFQEYAGSGESITDDSLVLQRLCVKLEYLLETCTKKKTVLGGCKHYWHWMRESLRRTKRFSDGLKFIETNKEVRTPQGRGRALIRYSLVHQTLADNFQHCLMNQSTCAHYLKPTCILMRPLHAALFLSTLYEINAVRFDLNSKGYDLDTAWPTFASKRCSTGFDEWPMSVDRTVSLGSYISHVNNSALMMPDVTNIRSAYSTSGILDCEGRATAGTGPPSVDHRVEELVLELNESDQKIQDREEALKQLEMEADAAVKSATEEKEILAGLVSDLQSKNLSLHGALSQMSTECQNREQSWQLQCDQLRSTLAEIKETNSNLRSTVSTLEEDKRNLEDTVSARMTRITSGFSGTDIKSMDFAAIGNESADGVQLQQMLSDSEKARKDLEEQISSLRIDLAAVPERLEAEKKALASSLTTEFESVRVEWERKVAAAYEGAASYVLKKVTDVMPAGFATPLLKSRPLHENVDGLVAGIMDLAKELTELRKKSTELQDRRFDPVSELAALEEKHRALEKKGDDALCTVAKLNEEVGNARAEFRSFKLECEMEADVHRRDMMDASAANRRFQEKVKKDQLTNGLLAEEICRQQRQCDVSAVGLKSCIQGCVELQEKAG